MNSKTKSSLDSTTTVHSITRSTMHFIVHISLSLVLLLMATWYSAETALAEQVEVEICAPEQLVNAILTLNQNNEPNIVDTLILPSFCVFDFVDAFDGDFAIPKITADLLIEGNDATIQRNDNANPMQLLYVDSGATKVSLQNLTLRGGIARIGGGALAIARSNIDVSLKSVDLWDNKGFTGGAIYSESPLPLKISGSRIEDNSANFGGAIYAPKVELHSTVFINNEAEVDGGAVYASEAFSTLERTGYSGNSAGNQGGAVYAAKSVVTFEADFKANKAGAKGGAIFQASARDAVESTSTSFRLNEAPIGGALHTAGPITIIGGHFEENSAVNAAGALLAAGDIVMRNSTFNQNRTTAGGSQGGAVRLAGPTAILEEVNFDGNDADDEGGGIVATDTVASLAILGGQFSGNRSTNDNGGAISSRAQKTSISTVTFVANSAKNGGALYVRRGATAPGSLEIARSIFSKNFGSVGGGAVAVFNNVPTTIVGSEFTANAVEATTKSAGSALISASPLSITDSHFSNNENAAVGGAIYALNAVEIQKSYFGDNFASQSGGALYLAADLRTEASSKLVNNVWHRNLVRLSGSAININLDVADPASPANQVSIWHNTIVNSATPGVSAVHVQAGQVEVANSIVAAHGIGIQNVDGSVASRYNLFDQNEQDVAGNVQQEDDLNGAPNFVSPQNWQLAAGSPAINSGTDLGITTDYEGYARPNGAGFDRGAYEYQGDDPAPRPTPVPPTATPEPATPEPTATTEPATPEPTATAEPATPEPTSVPATPQPTMTPTVPMPTATQEVPPTSEPIRTSEPGVTAAPPTITPVATSTTGPVNPSPEPTEAPVDIPTPIKTLEPTPVAPTPVAPTAEAPVTTPISAPTDEPSSNEPAVPAEPTEAPVDPITEPGDDSGNDSGGGSASGPGDVADDAPLQEQPSGVGDTAERLYLPMIQ